MKYISVLKRFNSVVESRNSSLKNEYKRLCENLEDGMEEEDPVDQIPVDEGAGNGEVDYDSFFAEDSTPVDGEKQLDEEDDVTEIPASEVFNQETPEQGSVAEGDEMAVDVDADPDADGLSEDSIEVVDDEILEGDDCDGCDDNISTEDPDGLMEDGDETGEQSPEKVDDVAELFDDEGGDSGDAGEGGEATDDGGEEADVPNDNPEEKIEEVPSDDGKSEGDENKEDGGKSEGEDAEGGETSSDSGESSEGDDAGKGDEGGEEKPKEEPKEEPKDDAGKGEGGEEKPKEEKPKEDGGDEGNKEEVNEEFDPNAYFNDNPDNATQTSDTQDGLAEGEEPKMVPLSEITEQDDEGADDEFTAPVEGEPEGDEEVTVDEDDDEPYDTLENPDEDDELDESVVQAFNLNRRLLKKR